MSWIKNIIHKNWLGTVLLIVIRNDLPKHHIRVPFFNISNAICSKDLRLVNFTDSFLAVLLRPIGIL